MGRLGLIQVLFLYMVVSTSAQRFYVGPNKPPNYRRPIRPPLTQSRTDLFPPPPQQHRVRPPGGFIRFPSNGIPPLHLIPQQQLVRHFKPEVLPPPLRHVNTIVETPPTPPTPPPPPPESPRDQSGLHFEFGFTPIARPVIQQQLQHQQQTAQQQQQRFEQQRIEQQQQQTAQQQQQQRFDQKQQQRFEQQQQQKFEQQQQQRIEQQQQQQRFEQQQQQQQIAQQQFEQQQQQHQIAQQKFEQQQQQQFGKKQQQFSQQPQSLQQQQFSQQQTIEQQLHHLGQQLQILGHEPTFSNQQHVHSNEVSHEIEIPGLSLPSPSPTIRVSASSPVVSVVRRPSSTPAPLEIVSSVSISTSVVRPNKTRLAVARPKHSDSLQELKGPGKSCGQWSQFGFCELSANYPQLAVEGIARQCHALLLHMYAPLPEESSGNLEDKSHPSYNGHGGDVTPPRTERANLQPWSWAAYKAKSAACSSKSQLVRPGWLRAEDGTWMTVLQTANQPQPLPVTVCSSPGAPCSGPGCNNPKSKCVQQYMYHRMIVLNPDNPNHCPVMKAFRFPSACVCYLDATKQ